MKRDVLANQVYQLHEDAGVMMPLIHGMTGHLMLLAQQYKALREEAKKLVPESEQAAWPPEASDDAPVSYSMVEIYLFSGQLMAILREA